MFNITIKNHPRTIALALIVLLLIPLAVFSQDEPEEEKNRDEEKPSEKEPGEIRRFFKDAGEIWSSPFRIRAKDLLGLGLVASGTAVMIANDEGIYREIKNYQNQNEWVNRASPTLSKLCEGYPFGIAGLFLLYGLVGKDAKARDTGSMALQAMIHSFLVVQLVKHLTGRQRPSVDGSDFWHGPAGFFKRYTEGYARYDAFFSGHTVTIWSLATVVAHQYRGIVPWIAYGVAAAAGMATITEDLHWISEVFVGAVVGYAIGRLVWKNRRRSFQVMPGLQPNGIGLSLSLELP